MGGLQREEAYVQGTSREARPERIPDPGGSFDGDGAGLGRAHESRCNRLDRRSSWQSFIPGNSAVQEQSLFRALTPRLPLTAAL